MTLDSDEVAIETGVTPEGDRRSEAKLSTEIKALWATHQDGNATVTRTRSELENLRRDLGERLYRMKCLLVRTGRGGRWAAYLREQAIPRASGNRLVKRHEEALIPKSEKRLNETIPTSTEQEIEGLFQKLRPRLLKVLDSQEAAFHFVVQMICGLPGIRGDVTPDGALIFDPENLAACGTHSAGREAMVPVRVE